MHKYTNDIITENNSQRSNPNRYTFGDYFGEESDRCGSCDFCLERNELDMSKLEFDVILEEIKNILSWTKN